jgi:NAD+ kinase
MRTTGLVVNPIAGMGGRVGLKGTDGNVERARELGAAPRARERAREALEALAGTGADVDLLAAGGVMGERVSRDGGFEPTVVSDPPGETTAADTRSAVAAFLDRGADLILFVGGDGTAADVAETIEDRDADVPMLGVPAGVKIFSAVFGVTPAAAGRIAATYERTERAEVNDVDEERYREGEVRPELRAVVSVPATPDRQGGKERVGGNVEPPAQAVAEDVESGVTYVFGPGSTVGAVEDALGIDGTPLGIDVWRNGAVLVRDGGEADVLDALGEENEIVVSPVGGQGFVFGRGNQQLSPAVVQQAEVSVIASRRKLDDVGVLRVDTGDPDLDAELRGWWRVRVGAVERRLIELV